MDDRIIYPKPAATEGTADVNTTVQDSPVVEVMKARKRYALSTSPLGMNRAQRRLADKAKQKAAAR